MSKKMTPCEKLGYEVGDKFELVEQSYMFDVGDIVSLQDDDGTESPYFTNESVKDECPYGVSCFLYSIKKVAKLKPAKQALADAIHQNGGWPESELLDFATSNAFGEVLCSASHPERKGNVWVNGDYYRLISCIKGTIANWHQTVLSRDEYFTAYPEQVKVEANNETKHQVEVEIESESEVTIKVSDWHKNGELPPVGTWCTLHAKENNGEEVMFIGVTSCNSPVFETVQNMIFVERGEFRFSPLRTERERAIDEIIKVINRYDYYGSLNFDVVASDIANAMFDEGFRKEVK